jgi:hypothetical protein
MSKIVAVFQKPEKTLTVFYEKLCEAFLQFRSAEHEQIVNMVFVAQSYSNIHQKLQKLEGFSC